MKNNGKQLISILERATGAIPFRYTTRPAGTHDCVAMRVDSGNTLLTLTCIMDEYWVSETTNLETDSDYCTAEFGVEFGCPSIYETSTEQVLYWPDVAWPENVDDTTREKEG